MDKHKISKYIEALKSKGNKLLDQKFSDTDRKVFAKTNCLDCAECCKKYSPILSVDDINRIGLRLEMTFEEMIDTYIEMDEEGDFVFISQPCPMLDIKSNKCKVYDIRPTSCSSYPHTNMKEMKEHLSLLKTNTSICPAAYEILEEVYTNIAE